MSVVLDFISWLRSQSGDEKEGTYFPLLIWWKKKTNMGKEEFYSITTKK